MKDRLSIPSVIIGAILTTIVTLLGTWIYSTITEKHPLLQYRLTAGPPLPGSLSRSGVYVVEFQIPAKKRPRRSGLTSGFLMVLLRKRA
jgi:hypothetical protein